jgi:hemolysin III
MIDHKEEFANALIHGIGALLFMVIAPFLLFFARDHSRTIWPVLGYILCLIIMYINSTVYHTVTDQSLKRKFRVVDHVSIFLLIGGTFTPIVVYNMGTWNGWPFLIGFWIAMLLGIVFKIFFTGRFKLVSTIIYVGVAWAGAAFSWPIIHNMSRQVLGCLIIGGIFYTGGTFFYMRKNLTYHHSIWHLFVLAGSIWHFMAVRLSIPG